ncbi:integrase arm-type DNA-binding domain-containing protein [Vibrio harveyi]
MLSDSKLKSYHRKSQDKQIVLSDRDGLYARISKVGGISFFIRYRYGGKQDQLTIGKYPEVSLKEAREKSLHYRSILLSGKNPKIQKKLEFSSAENAMTFKGLIELWYEKEAKQRKKKHAWILRTIERHMYPLFENAPIEDITTHHFYDALDGVSKSAPSQVQNIISNVRQAFSMAVRRKLISENPLVGISSNRDFNVERKEGERTLDDDELRRLMAYTFESRYTRKGLIVFLALFFGFRMGEIGKAEIKHFDFFNMLWTVPPENHKTGKRTKKPIIRVIDKSIVPMIEMLAGLSADGIHLLTSQKTGTKLKDDFWTHFPKHINTWLEKNGLERIENWSMHDLRRTQRTNMSRLAEPHVCEILLGHKLPGVWQTYDKDLYIDEQREAYSKWWDRLQKIRLNEDNTIKINKAV